MCRNEITMGVKVSSAASPEHHLNPYARPYNKTPSLYFVQTLLPLRYYYPQVQYTIYHKSACNNTDPPKQTAKNMNIERCHPNRRFLPPRQRPRKVWRPKLQNGASQNLHIDAPVVSTPVVSAPSAPSTPALFVHGDDATQNTSVMMRNIPNQYSRDELMKFVDKYCAEHKLEYDFFYLPIDFRRHQNKGYAFINFTKPPYAKMFEQAMTGYKWGLNQFGDKSFTSKKICKITWAKIQGKEGFVRHFMSSKFPCYCEHYLPVVLSPPSNGDASLSTLTTVGFYWNAA